MRKILPLILALIGTAAGVGAGVMLRPAPEAHVEIMDEDAHIEEDHANEDTKEYTDTTFEYARLNNQFVVPVVADSRVQALVVLALSIEIIAGNKETVFTREPKLRDAFLQVMFDHANMGGFHGSFTDSNNLDVLRLGLRRAANEVLGDLANDVLIVDIVRQDI